MQPIRDTPEKIEKSSCFCFRSNREKRRSFDVESRMNVDKNLQDLILDNPFKVEQSTLMEDLLGRITVEFGPKYHIPLDVLERLIKILAQMKRDEVTSHTKKITVAEYD